MILLFFTFLMKFNDFRFNKYSKYICREHEKYEEQQITSIIFVIRKYIPLTRGYEIQSKEIMLQRVVKKN